MVIKENSSPRSPHPFSLRQLQYAVAVADALSFRRAAQQCRVSQPALSAQIAQVEAAAGVVLFERDRRRVRVTPRGEEFLARARRVLAEADDLLTSARRLADPFDGILRVGVIPTISPYLLPVITPPLRAEFPRLSLRWVEDRTADLVRGLQQGTLDAALLALEAEIGEVDYEVVGRDPFVLAVPAAHALAARRGPVAMDNLEEARVLLLDDGHCFRDQALAFCAGAGARELEFRATSLSTLAQMVAAGAGITLLPEIAVRTEAQRSGLAIRPLARPVPARTIVLCWRRRSSLGPALHTLASSLHRAYPRPAGLLPGTTPRPVRGGPAAENARRAPGAGKKPSE